MPETIINMPTCIHPTYYKDFSCIADECLDNCCSSGFHIDIDPETLKKWQSLKEEIRLSDGRSYPAPADCIETMKNGKNDVRHVVRLNDRSSCPLLTKEGLCSLVIAHGDQMLTCICRDFPRQTAKEGELTTKSVALRCKSVLDLLWIQKEFSYEIAAEETDPVIPFRAYPAIFLLDAMLSLSRDSDVTAELLLAAMFKAFHKTHTELRKALSADENGYVEYGQELLTEENVKLVSERTEEELKSLKIKNLKPAAKCPDLKLLDFLMREVMHDFFHRPVYKEGFTKLAGLSEELLKKSVSKQRRSYEAMRKRENRLEKEMKLLVCEELFTSVFTIDALDFETILARLQWLILQYITIRYIHFLDICDKGQTDLNLYKHQIARIFRVTDYPDILKVFFFDAQVTNWLWQPDGKEIGLLLSL